MNEQIRVLIVDDNKMNVKIATRLLSEINCIIDECYDGMECLAKIDEGNKYDIILMDIMMPNLDGLETVIILKSKYNLSTPVIAVTADASEGAREKCIEAGCVEYISKPLYKDLLINTVKKILNI